MPCVAAVCLSKLHWDLPVTLFSYRYTIYVESMTIVLKAQQRTRPVMWGEPSSGFYRLLSGNRVAAGYTRSGVPGDPPKAEERREVDPFQGGPRASFRTRLRGDQCKSSQSPAMELESFRPLVYSICKRVSVSTARAM